MTRYLLDTTVLIDHLRGDRRVTEVLARMAIEGDELGVCAVNIAELYSGLTESEQGAAQELIGNLYYYEISRDVARAAGQYRFGFARRGTTLTVTDTLVAATAVNFGAILLTANVKDYPMTDIELRQLP